MLCLALAATVGCTRKAANEKATFSLSLPTDKKVRGKGATTLSAQLQHVVVNVSGPGMGILTCNYDVERASGAGPCKFEYPTITVDVTTGTSRLVQVLVAYENDQSGMMSVSYGDATQDFVAGDNLVPIQLQDVSGSGRSGHIRGRYLTSPTEGPTGVLEVKAKPVADRPSMILTRQEMFSGYFDAFAVEFFPLEYMINGSSIFGKGMTYTDFQALRIQTPTQVRILTGASEFDIIGFFGAPPNIAGKFADNDGSCDGSEFDSCFKSTSHFTAPFRESAGNLLQPAGPVYNFANLPNMTGVIDGFKIFRVADYTLAGFASKFFIEENMVNCKILETEATLVATVPLGTTNFNIGSSRTGNQLIVACPYKGTQLFNTAAMDPRLNGGGGGDSKPYMRLEFMSGNNQSLVREECVPVQLRTFAAGGGNPAPPYNLTNILNISFPAGGVLENRIFDDFSNCQANFSALPSTSILSGQNTRTGLYLRVPSANFQINAASVGLSSPPAPSPEVAIGHGDEIFVTGDRRLKWIAPPQLVAGQCYKLPLLRIRPDNSSFMANESTIVTFTTAGSNLYGDSNCTSGSTIYTPSFAPLIGETATYFKATAGAYAITAAASGYASVVYNVNVVAQPASATRLMVTAVNPPVDLGVCEEFQVTSVNQNNVPVPAPFPINVNVALDRPGVKTFYDGSCSSPLSSPTIFTGDYSIRFFVMSQVIGSFGVTVTGSGGLTNVIPTIPTFNVATPGNATVGEPWIAMDLPLFPDAPVGDHEFPRPITITTSPMTSVDCEFYSAGTWYLCDAAWNPSTRKLNMDGNNVRLMTQYRFTARRGGYWKEAHFHPSLFGMNFNALACTQTLGGANLVQASIASALAGFSGFGDTLCLDAGLVNVSGSALDISGPYNVVGKISPTTGLVTTELVSSTVNIFRANFTTSTENKAIANLRLRINDAVGFNGSRSAIGVDVMGGDGYLRTFNNTFTIYSTDDAVSAVKSTVGGVSYESKSDVFEINSLATAVPNGGVGIYIKAPTLGANIYGSKFQMNSSPMTEPPVAILGESQATGIPSLIADKVKIMGNGTAFRAIEGANSGQVSITVTHAYVKLDAASALSGGITPRYVFEGAKGDHNFNMMFSRVQTNFADSSPFYTNTTSGSTNMRVQNFDGNTFIQERDLPMFKFEDAAATNATVSTRMVRNHFVRVVGAGITASAIQNNMPANNLWLERNSGGDPPEGENKYCAVSGLNQWASGFAGNVIGGSFPLSFPSPGTFPNSLDPIVLRCP